MKTQRFLAIMAMAATIGVAMTACNDKETEKTDQFVGKYNIVLKATTQDGSLVTTDTMQTLDVSISDDATYYTASTSFKVQSVINISVSNLKFDTLMRVGTNVGFKIPQCDDVKLNENRVGSVEGTHEFQAGYDGGFSVVNGIESIEFKVKGSVTIAPTTSPMNINIHVKGQKQ